MVGNGGWMMMKKPIGTCEAAMMLCNQTLAVGVKMLLGLRKSEIEWGITEEGQSWCSVLGQ